MIVHNTLRGLPLHGGETADSTKRYRIVSLQYLRFAAALMVVYHHAGGLANRQSGSLQWLPSGQLADIGAFGVDIFFVISGFVIAGSFASVPSAGQFARHRIERVVPLYWLVSLPLIYIAAHTTGIHLPQVLATFLFWPVTPSGISEPFLSVGWSLCFEMLFYACTTLSLMVMRGRPHLRGRTVLTGWVVAFLVAFALAGSVPFPFVFLGNPIIIEFMLGFGLARIWAGRRVYDSRLGAAALVCACVWLTLSFANGVVPAVAEATATLDGTLALPRVLYWGGPAALIVYATLQFEGLVASGSLARIISFLGDASYSIYLVHRLMFALVEPRAHAQLSALGSDALLIGSIVASILVGILVYVLVERPLLRAVRHGLPIGLMRFTR